MSKPKRPIYAGIDNGLDGGIGIIDTNGKIIMRDKMPTVKLGKGRNIDIPAILAMLEDVDMVIVEAAAKHSPGKLALCSTWYSFGQLIGAITATRKKHSTINPQKWQKEFWVRSKMPAGSSFDTKAAALNAAKSIWTDESFLATTRSTKAHDGIVDALLIAEYARRKNL